MLASVLRRPVATSLLAIGCVLLGLLAYLHLPVAALPAVDLPTVVVNATLPGASPETMATSVANPLERRLGQIAGVSELTSVNVQGVTQITVQFGLDRDVAGAASDVQAAVNGAATELPKDMPSPPLIAKLNPAMVPIIFLAVTCDTLPAGEVFDAVDRIVAQRLAQIDGVSRVAIQGAQRSAVRVRVNPSVLAAMSLSLGDVRDALAAANSNGPKGLIDNGAKSTTIAANDQLFGANAYRSVAVARRDGAVVRLGDVAEVVDSVANNRVAGWFNGKPAIFVFVQREAGANIVETAARVRALLPQLENWLPRAVKVSVVTDRTDMIEATMADSFRTLVLTSLAVVAMLYLFLRDLRAATVPSLAIPVSIVGTFGLMWLLDYTLDTISLTALTVSIGFVVDDAIVVIENIARMRESGLSRHEATLVGARQIAFTIISITLSLVAALLPLILVPGVVGEFLREFSVTLTGAILISAVVSLTLTPVMCARFLTDRPALPARAPGPAGRLTDAVAAAILSAYGRSLAVALRHRRLTMLATLAVTIATFVLFGAVPKGLLPAQDTGLVIGFTEASQDISFAAMAEHQQKVAAAVLADPAVAGVTSYVGSATGMTAANGRMFVGLKPYRERAGQSEVIARLRPKLAAITGITTSLQGVEDAGVGAREGQGKYQFTLQDDDWGELNRAFPAVLERLRQIPLLRDVGSDQQNGGLQTYLRIDRDRAALYGVSPEAIDQALYDAFGQRQVSTVYTSEGQYLVVLEVDPRDQVDLEGLQRIPVKSASGDNVPMRSVTTLTTGTTALAIAHQGQFPAITITFNLAPDAAISQAIDAIEPAVAALKLPPGLRTSFEGNAKAHSSAAGSEPWLVLAAVLTIYIVLGVLYESYIHPLTILSTLPSAALGALVALVICREQLTIISFVGIILLLGIVKKNGIMMVDFALAAERREGLSPEAAIEKACLLRFRPIMMTTMTALIGALPLALDTGAGSELRRVLGIVIVGGLIGSQIMTLYTTPVIYLYLDRASRWLRARAGRKRRAAVAAPAEVAGAG